MVDLDSNPTKLIDVVEIGKQLLITRGALTTFSIANDVAKYFAIIPALFAGTYVFRNNRPLEALNIMHLHSAKRRAVGRYLQRVGHRRAHSTGPPRCEIPPHRVGVDLASQRVDLRCRGVIVRSSSSNSSTSSCRPPRLLKGVRLMLVHLRRSLVMAVICLVFSVSSTPSPAPECSGAVPVQADGSMTKNGSLLIGQNWSSPKWFHGRPDDAVPTRQCDTSSGDNRSSRTVTTVSRPLQPGTALESARGEHEGTRRVLAQARREAHDRPGYHVG